MLTDGRETWKLAGFQRILGNETIASFSCWCYFGTKVVRFIFFICLSVNRSVEVVFEQVDSHDCKQEVTPPSCMLTPLCVFCLCICGTV